MNIAMNIINFSQSKLLIVTAYSIHKQWVIFLRAQMHYSDVHSVVSVTSENTYFCTLSLFYLTVGL